MLPRKGGTVPADVLSSVPSAPAWAAGQEGAVQSGKELVSGTRPGAARLAGEKLLSSSRSGLRPFANYSHSH